MSTDYFNVERVEIQRQIENGEICPCCLTAECDRELIERRIRINDRAAYPVYNTCFVYAERLQKSEDLKRAGIQQDVVAGLHRLSGIPDKFSAATFQQYRVTPGNTEAWARCMSFGANYPTKSICLLGPRGTGKTMLGCAALLHIVNRKAVESRYLYAPDLLELLRERYWDPHVEFRIRELCSIPAIFVDDIGSEKDSAWTESIYTQIIDGRYRNQKPTILASNLDVDSLASVVGDRSISRIVEQYEIIEMKGEDWRLCDAE